MNVLLLMIPMAILFGMIFIACFILSVKSGQYDDLDTPANRLLLDDHEFQKNPSIVCKRKVNNSPLKGGSHG